MNTVRRSLGILAICVLLSACVAAPKVAMNPDAKKSVKRIALVTAPEPAEYAMFPGQAPGGAVLYLFGALGGAILGGIEASRYNEATLRFTTALKPLQPELSSQLLTRLESGLTGKGYEVIRVPVPPKDAEGKDLDYTKVQGSFDAILSPVLMAGYANDAGAVAPRVSVGVALVSKNGTEKLFSDTYLYGLRKVGDLVHIEPDSKFRVKTVDDVYLDVRLALEGLRTGTDKIAERIVAEL